MVEIIDAPVKIEHLIREVSILSRAGLLTKEKALIVQHMRACGIAEKQKPRRSLTVFPRQSIARLGSFVASAHQIEAASSASFATVLMFRAVPYAAAGILSFERPIPAP
ncbi:MAG: hypothetical protein J0H18_06935 [Rhizobiales bacterium]|nr:hypothetical protein [Hyphomicrobiales bacterium]